MGKIKISCVTSLEDIQLETLRDEQALNVGSFSVPVGIESEGSTECKVLSIEEKDDKTVTEELGEFSVKTALDEGNLYTDFEISDDLPEELEEEINLSILDLL